MNLVWHRAELRLHDNPALKAATHAGPTVGVVVFDPRVLEFTSPRRRAWFFENVKALRNAYLSRGGFLLTRSGPPWEVLPRLVAELGVHKIYAARNFTPYAAERDAKVESRLAGKMSWHDGQYIHQPGTILRPDGGAYSVFTPYSKRWWAAGEPAQPQAPERFTWVNLPEGYNQGEIPSELSDVPLPVPGEEAALRALEVFVSDKLHRYHQTRDALSGQGTSRLSAYFTIGVLSPRLAMTRALRSGAGEGGRKWVSELAWRDFSADLMFHRPEMLDQAFDSRFNRLPWNPDPTLYQAWLHGQTGVPVVDAAMRELRATGMTSNRARMCVAQFAVKLALLPWKQCERDFRDLLLDGDTATNVQGWQWAGGLGVDAAPYFRVYNMEKQAETHDPTGDWLRQWAPESLGKPQPYKPLAFDLDFIRMRYLEAAAKILKG